MARMDPVSGKKFKTGNNNRTGDPAADFDFVKMANDPNIVAIFTIDKFGAITLWNHPNTPANERMNDKTGMSPYVTGGLVDVNNITLAIYVEEDDPTYVELGVWFGNPVRCYT